LSLSSSIEYQPKRTLIKGTTSPSSHLPVLDGLRGIAILLVLGTHFAQGGHHNPVLKIFFAVTSFGWSGVDLFFVLSGFLITRILLSAKGAKGYFRNFYMRRVLRIFPLYYGVLGASLVLAPLFVQGPKPGLSQLWLWLYGQNLREALTGMPSVMQNPLGLYFGHFWSLAVEEHFYLVWPAIVLFSSLSTLKRVCGVIVVCALFMRIGAVLVGATVDVVHDATPFRMDALAIGGLIAAYAVGGYGLDALQRLSKLVVAVGIGMLLLIWLVKGDLFFDNKYWLTAGFSCVSWFYGGFLILAVSAPIGGLPHKALTLRPLLFLGKYSYGIYVIHGLLWSWFNVWFSTRKIRALVSSYFAALFLHLLLSTLVTVGLAFVSWHLFEKQFLKLKRLFEYRRSSTVQSSDEGVVAGDQRASSMNDRKSSPVPS